MKKLVLFLVFAILLISLITIAMTEGKGEDIKKIISEKGEEIEIKKVDGTEKTKIKADDKEAETELEIEEETAEAEDEEKNITQNKTKLKVTLSNGRKAEIKIMPDAASERAIERLGELNFTIQLKEVGKGNETKLAYEVQAERHYKLLGLFRIKAKNKAEIDAETGEIITTKKPWWAFLARED